jgi:tagaturonate reductase
MAVIPLKKENLEKIESENGLIKPNEHVFVLPEKIISFGTGVLLKGLPYYFVNKANNQGIFNGRILAVKSTPSNSEIESLANQDFLYALQSNGVKNNIETCETSIIAAISRVLHAEENWKEILKAAHNPDLQIVISNTTEIGLNMPEIGDVNNYPPKSFPGKLLMFLYERFIAFNGSSESGMVIIPTELVVNNGNILKEVLQKLAFENNLNQTFIDWLENNNIFCNSLVDRIVTGKPAPAVFEKFETDFSFSDPNLILSETYCLWAIEGNAKVKEILNFAKADPCCIIANDIEKYRELKLRLLNGSHSLMVGFGYFKGLKTVKECLGNEAINSFLENFIFDEIIPTLTIEREKASTYAHEVLDRFRNPNIDHKLLGITVQYSSKMKSRIVPILINYYEKFGKIPPSITKGFAYFLKFMKVAKIENDQFLGSLDNHFYPIQDINAQYFATISFNKSNKEYINLALKNEELWGINLLNLEGFETAILSYF